MRDRAGSMELSKWIIILVRYRREGCCMPLRMTRARNFSGVTLVCCRIECAKIRTTYWRAWVFFTNGTRKQILERMRVSCSEWRITKVYLNNKWHLVLRLWWLNLTSPQPLFRGDLSMINYSILSFPNELTSIDLGVTISTVDVQNEVVRECEDLYSHGKVHVNQSFAMSSIRFTGTVKDLNRFCSVGAVVGNVNEFICQQH